MRINPTYRALLDKSVDSMLSAIEIYNKPNFKYREETFAVLAINAWELLLKAYILKVNRYKIKSIYVMESVTNKDGTVSLRRKKAKQNRCNKPMSISIIEAISLLEKMGKLPKKLRDNLEALIELRDNSIHFVNLSPISRQIQELGFACIKNYIGVIKDWKLAIDVSSYNLYLMPLAYIDEKITIPSVITAENQSYLSFVKNLLENDDKEESDYDIAISIDIDFKKGNTFDSIGVYYDGAGLAVSLTEKNIRQKFPWDYSTVVKRCKARYSDFKVNQDFHAHMREIKGNNKLCNERLLYPGNPKSGRAFFYSSNILQKLDTIYHKK